MRIKMLRGIIGLLAAGLMMSSCSNGQSDIYADVSSDKQAGASTDEPAVESNSEGVESPPTVSESATGDVLAAYTTFLDEFYNYVIDGTSSLEEYASPEIVAEADRLYEENQEFLANDASFQGREDIWVVPDLIDVKGDAERVELRTCDERTDTIMDFLQPLEYFEHLTTLEAEGDGWRVTSYAEVPVEPGDYRCTFSYFGPKSEEAVALFLEAFDNSYRTPWDPDPNLAVYMEPDGYNSLSESLVDAAAEGIYSDDEMIHHPKTLGPDLSGRIFVVRVCTDLPNGVAERQRDTGETITEPAFVGQAMMTDYRVKFDWPEEESDPQDQQPGWEIVNDRGNPTPVESCDGFVETE